MHGRDLVAAWHARRADGDRPAVADGRSAWTHAELRAAASAWADAVPAGAPVAVSLPQGCEAVAAWLGVLLAGEVVLPLDPRHPLPERLARLRAAGAGAALVDAAGATELVDAGWKGRCVTEPGEPGPADSARRVEPDADAPALLYATSGTTGEPRLLAWSRRTLATATAHLTTMLELGAEDRHALLSPLAVAPTAAQITAVIGAGAELRILDARDHGAGETARWIADHRITTLQTVPSLFRALAANAGGATRWPALRAVKLGGESVTARDARDFAAVAPAGAFLVNGLGLTEAGFNVCWHVWRAGDPLEGEQLPIGRPPPGVEIRLVTPGGRDAAAGETGEIVVRCAGLALGRFDPDAPLRAPAELRTGDAGRRRPDGLLEHAGRLDLLVSVRGHLVDPAAVEAAVLALDGVDDAAVVAGDGRLAAHVVSGTQTASTIRTALARRLPPQMVPGSVRLAETLPRLPGGKVDRARLPVAVADGSGDRDGTPADALERTIAAAFSRALPGHPAVGVHDDFFADLGGDSLAAVEVAAHLAGVLGMEVPLVELAREPTAAALAVLLRARGWNLTQHPVTLLTRAPGPDAITLFTWPGAGSDVMALLALADSLGPGFAVHGIAHRGADGRRIFDTSLGEIAARGARLVREIQPHGPYALCGSSFGGVVAIEVAARLADAGAEVALVALLDTYGPGYPRARLRGLGPRGLARHVVRALRPIGAKDEPGWPVLRRGLEDHAMRLAARRAVRVAQPEAPLLHGRRRYIHLTEACFTAGRGWRPRRYAFPVLLLAAEDRPPADLFVMDDSLGWRPWVDGPFAVEPVPGRHGAHIQPPNVTVLAGKLESALRRSFSSDGGPCPAAGDGAAGPPGAADRSAASAGPP